MTRDLAAAVALSICVQAAGAAAATLRVPGQLPSIGAAMDAAASGDTVLVAPGQYYELGIVLKGGVTLRGEGDGVVISGNVGGDAGTALIAHAQSEEIRLERLAVRGSGDIDWGAAIDARDSHLRIENCVFRGSSTHSSYDGTLRSRRSVVELIDCRFEHNGFYKVEFSFGTSICAFDSEFIVERTWFVDNNTFIGSDIHSERTSWTCSDCLFSGGDDGSTLLSFSDSVVDLERCVFRDNEGSDLVLGGGGSLLARDCLFDADGAQSGPYSRGGIAVGQGSAAELINCTLAFTSVTEWGWCAIRVGGTVTLRRSLVLVSNGRKAACCWDGSLLVVRCADLYAQGNVHVVDCESHELDIEEVLRVEPQFCGVPGSGNYYLQSDSPCSPAHNLCGELIGAFPVGCELTATAPMSFGAIKALY